MSGETTQPPTTPRVRTRARPRAMEIGTPAPPPPPDPFDPGAIVNHPTPSTNLAQRMRDVYRTNRKGMGDFVCLYMLPMVQQQRPLDEIARIFGISHRQAERWKAYLFTRIGDEYRRNPPSHYLARQIAELERTKAFAWQQASLIPNFTVNREIVMVDEGGNRIRQILDASEIGQLANAKRGWVAMALKADAQLTTVYERAGLLKHAPMAPDIDDADAEDETGGKTVLASIAKEFLTGGYASAKKKVAETVTNDSRDDLAVMDEGQFLL